jgi:NADH-quinone oxidoreductase subunit C
LSSSEAEGATTAEDAAGEAASDETVDVDERREGTVQAFRTELGDAVVGDHVTPGIDVWVRVTVESWVAAGTFARDRLGCSYFDFLSAIDWLPSPFGRDMDAQEDLIAGPGAVDDTGEAGPEPMEQGLAGGETRFQLLARVDNPEDGHGVFLKCDVEGEPPSAPSWVPVYAGANWHERETSEMFGIDFVGHPNLVKLYLPGAFEGFPLRKDFPLLARRVKPWPGIVDVEQMPGEDDEADGDDGNGS